MADAADYGSMNDADLESARRQLNDKITAQEPKLDRAGWGPAFDELQAEANAWRAEVRQITAILDEHRKQSGETGHYDDGHSFGWKKEPEPTGSWTTLTSDPTATDDWVDPHADPEGPRSGPNPHVESIPGKGPLPHVPFWEKVAAAIAAAVAVAFGVVGMNIGDTTTTATVAVSGSSSGSDAHQTPAASPATVTPSINTFVISTDHGDKGGGFVYMPTGAFPSDIPICFSADGLHLGSIVTFHLTGPNGAFDASAPIGADGRGVAVGGISTFGVYDVTGAEALLAVDQPTSKVALDLPSGATTEHTVDASEAPCDKNDVPEGALADTTTKPEPAPTPDTTPEAKSVTEDTDGQPWSLAVALGGVLGVGGVLLIDEERRRREETGDDWRSMYPDFYGEGSGDTDPRPPDPVTENVGPPDPPVDRLDILGGDPKGVPPGWSPPDKDPGSDEMIDPGPVTDPPAAFNPFAKEKDTEAEPFHGDGE
jgi:hypothetical protein